MDLLHTTLSWLLQPAPDTRDTFAWLSTAADILGIAGGIASGIFWWRARKAATEAEEAVKGVRERLRRIETYAVAADLSSELWKLISQQENRQWEAVLARYDKVRPLVVQVRSGRIKLLSDVQLTKLTHASAQLTDIASAISSALHAGDEALENLNVARYNAFIAEIAETVEEILVTLRESA